ncbi:endonuclease MutS2 [Lacticaseibacillus camelliae]|uniref:Endonuclease MutS2 n=1 Tax=Lacticaseibacillus camelliae DSM 22697 = JCM 13995 TaxID=1423730 RepID=A0A0R2FDH9_9LACO|nr:endonuclease MutS2 [Lacticaseibacillus camelliae]KRN23052.1 MutS family ATPase [Lacticaseibacillus camelliae DSM 22697 = JCM 13995]
MNKKILSTLGFDQIKAALAKDVVTAAGHARALALTPTADRAKVQEALDETADGASILRLKGGMPLPELSDVGPALKRVDIGATLNGKELAQLTRVLRSVSAVDDFLTDLTDKIELRRVYTLQQQLTVLPELERRLYTAVDEEGNLTDEASETLRTVRNQIRQLEANIRSRMDSYIHGNMAKYLSDPIITLRDDRFVLPVRSDSRGQVAGVVHDQSASGATLFIEPQAIVEMNNRLREAQIEEQQEIARVLAELSATVAPYSKQIARNAAVLGHFDFINAKARYAREIKATEPLVSPKNEVDILQARHPLLDPHKVVPNDIVIGKDYQAIVVTGPNTGGKTITLKTLGLLQLMGQAGLFIPAAEESTIGVFSDVFADIGDEQSIEQSLSTFSGHMANIVDILDHLDDQALVLFDELGAGTDPQEGAALAIAILDEVGTIGADVVATTHYPELKLYGYNTPGTINASMEFDAATLQPTYRLLIGVPGRSNAFDISRRLGLDDAIVDRAKSLIADDSHDLNNMIADLESQRKAAETEYKAARADTDAAQKLLADLQAAYTAFEKEREAQLAKARDQANVMVEKAQKKADKIIRDLRQMQKAGSGSVKENQLIAAKTGLKQLHQDQPQPKNKVLRREKKKLALHPGDRVRVLSYDQTGDLLDQVDKTHWNVQLGILRMKIKTSDLEKVAEPTEQEPKRRVAIVKGGAASGPDTTLDLRGVRYEDAMARLDRYIDSALLAGYPQVTIIHGLGTGAIRNGVTEYLRRNSQVKKFGFAPQNAGGSGATIVQFK